MPQLGPTSFSLISDLNNQAGSPGVSVMVNGKSAMNDSWGAIYFWSGSSTAVADGFSVVQVNGVATGRWIRQSISMNVVSAASTLDLGTITGYYTFNGTTATWKLPALSASITARLILINQGSGIVNIISNTGFEDIDDSGTSLSSIQMMPGEHYIFYNNSLKFTSLQ